MSQSNLEEMTKAELIRELRKLRLATQRYGTTLNDNDPQRLIFELQVHQVQLEMQNRELRATQALLEESRSRYGDLYDFAPVGYCTLDLQGRIQELNLTGAALLGATREALVGQLFPSVTSVVDRRSFYDHLQRCVEKPGRVTTELTLSSPSDGERTIQLVSDPVPDARSAPHLFITALIDISPLKALEGRLRLLADAGEVLASSLDYRTTLAAVARITVAALADLCIVDARDQDGLAHGLEVLYADGKKHAALVQRTKECAELSGWWTPQAKVLASGEPILIAELSEQRLGAIAYNEAHADTIRAAGVHSLMIAPLKARGRTFGTLTLAAAESERRYTAADLILASELARRAATAIDNARLHDLAHRAVQARESLMSLVSHDLRNSLGVILLKAANLATLPSDDGNPSQHRQKAESIHRSADRMNRLIQDLLDVANIDGERLAVDKRPQPVDGLVAEALDSLQIVAAQRSLRLISELPDARLGVDCDRGRILQVFGNLIGNAIKFSREGGQIVVRAIAAEMEVLFSVEDTGVGIAPEDLPHVFDRFWQAKATARLGTGLGLSIVKGIVEGHGGRVWAESRAGLGSTFNFTLPRAPLTELPTQPTAEPTSPTLVDRAVRKLDGWAHPRPSAGRGGRPVVLVVDDEEDMREALCETLEQEGYAVTHTASGAEAMQYLRGKPAPFLIILDLKMPVMDGWEFLAQRNGDPQLRAIPVVVVTGQLNVEERVAAAHAAYVQKPVEVDRLMAAMQNVAP